MQEKTDSEADSSQMFVNLEACPSPSALGEGADPFPQIWFQE